MLHQPAEFLYAILGKYLLKLLLRQKLVIRIFEARYNSFGDEQPLPVAVLSATLTISVHQVARLPDAALDDPLQPLTLLDVRADDKGLDAAVGVDEDVAAPAPVPRVNDAAPVAVKGPRGAVGGEIVKDGRRETAEGRIVVRRKTSCEGDGALREGLGRIGAGHLHLRDVGDGEVAALHVGDQREGLDGGLNLGILACGILRGGGTRSVLVAHGWVMCSV